MDGPYGPEGYGRLQRQVVFASLRGRGKGFRRFIRFIRFIRFRGFCALWARKVLKIDRPGGPEGSEGKVLKFDGAFAPKVLRFDAACGCEGCG